MSLPTASMSPSSSSGFSAGTDRVVGPRDLAALHRDVWTLLLRYPVVFIGLPVLVYLPFDLATEAAVSAIAGDDFLRSMQVYQRVQGIVSLLVGSYVAASLLEAVRIAGRGEAPTIGAALRGAGPAFGRVLGTTFVTGLLTTLGLLLLVIPGLVLAVRYALAVPAAFFEHKDAGTARGRSAELVKVRGAWSVFAYSIVGGAVYFVVAGFFLPSMAFLAWDPEGVAAVVWGAVWTMPINVVLSGLVVGAALLYHDASGQAAAAVWPVGETLTTSSGARMPPPRSSGMVGLVVAAVVGAVGMLIGVPSVALGVWAVLSPESYLSVVANNELLRRYVDLLGG